MEAGTHGRNSRFLDTALYLRGSEIEITDENWMILQLLDFLRCPLKYSEFGEKHTEAVLRKHIKKNNLSIEQATPYLSQFPDWVESKLRKLCEDAI